MPGYLWDEYKNSPDKLLRHTRDALKERYPNSIVTYDTLVVVVNFTNFKFEVQPVFEDIEIDGLMSYKYPYTKTGVYRRTMPRHEQLEMTTFRSKYGDTHRLLCKMMRSWTNNVGLHIGGLLLDTLAYNFMKDDEDIATTTKSNFDTLCCSFFEFLKNEPEKDHYQALGSGQDVKIKQKFQGKAKKAYNLACKAISADNDKDSNGYWRDIFGNNFPKAESIQECLFTKSAECHEEFIEDIYPINISGILKIDCEVKSNGFRERLLSEILRNAQKISRVRTLDFYIEQTNIKEPYTIKWKVRNVGDEAERRNCIRGQIVNSNTRDGRCRHETSNFKGPHYVECYIIKDGYVVARDRIEVPIF